MAFMKFLVITVMISVSIASPIVPGHIQLYPYGYNGYGNGGYNHYHNGYNNYGNGGGIVITGVNRPGYHSHPPYQNHFYDSYPNYPVYGNPGYVGTGYGLLGGAGFGLNVGFAG